jgi:hypothetical protein
LVFLILLIIATGVLLAWLFVAVTRFSLADLRVRVLHPSLAREVRVEPGSVAATPEQVPPEPRVDPELEAELTVREHLYGRREPRA